MKLLTFAAACAALATLSAAPAFAADPVTAKLAQPVATPTKFIAGGAMFVCEGDSCIAQAATSQTLALATCKTIVGKVGAVTSFGAVKALDEGRLDSCNAAAKGDSQLAKK